VLENLSLLSSRLVLALVTRHVKGDGVKDTGEVIVVDKLQVAIKEAWPNTGCACGPSLASGNTYLSRPNALILGSPRQKGKELPGESSIGHGWM
jgi:hypothetical protein